MMSDTYNSLILWLGKNFDKFSNKEVAHIFESLSIAGLKQDDIFSAIVDRLK